MIQEQWATEQQLNEKKELIDKYMSNLTEEEKQLAETCFDKAFNIGVSTYSQGDSLMEETVYNMVLNKLEFRYTLLPITAFVGIKHRKIFMVANPYYLLDYFKQTDNELTETNLTTFYRGIIKHELLHVMLKHLVKDNKRPIAMIANVVTDALINREISEFKYLNMPTITPEKMLIERTNVPGGLLVPSEYATDHDFRWEEYYDYIFEQIKDQIQVIQITGSSLEQGNDTEQSSGQDGNLPQSMEEAGENTTGNLTAGDINPQSPDQVDELIQDMLNDIHEEAKRKLKGTGKAKLIGSLVFDTEVKRANKWKTLLRQIFKGNSLLYKHYSMKRKDKRTGLPPGKKYTYRGGLVYVFIDTSGSIGDNEMVEFAKELHAIMKKYNYKYKIFTFSYGLGNEIDIRKIKRREFEFSDRGGTSILEALDELEEKEMYKIPDIYIIFTDAYDDIPKPERFHGKKVIYALTADHSISSLDLIKEYGYDYLIVEEGDRE